MNVMTRGTVRARMSLSGAVLRVCTDDDGIDIELDEQVRRGLDRHDFAAWLMLPLAMRQNADLHVEGRGSTDTVRNAGRLAEIWSRWLPGHFRPVKVSFSDLYDAGADEPGRGDLCLYSGGIDSTYALLKRFRAGQRQALLTIHGMDYRHADEDRFAELVRKTSSFAALVGTERFFVRTNAYDAYKKHRVNLNGADIGHGFVLAGMGFLFSGLFGRVVLAADYRLDQQFAVHPWGTNAATNPCFDDGRFRLHTEGDDVTRAEKGPLLASCEEALASLTFCVDYRARPHNCGRCQKCVRTKTMFLAATGRLPALCLDNSLPPDCLSAFDLAKKHQRAFFFDLYETACRNGTVDAIPGLQAAHEAAIAPLQAHGAWQRLKRALRR